MIWNSLLPIARPQVAAAFAGGALIGTFGGMIGLGGAEFRLPLLITAFGFQALEAVILNKAMSLVVVLTALPSRSASIPIAQVAGHWSVVVNLLAGSLAGAWFGADWATKLRAVTFYRTIAVLLVFIAVALLFGHEWEGSAFQAMTNEAQALVGVIAGFAIGAIASLLGVAGGELLIPTIVLLFGADIKLAGSLSLAVSLPTMIVGFTRYSRDASFSVIWRYRVFAGWMAAGSIAGAFVGALLLSVVSGALLLPLLAAVLLVSAWKIWPQGA